MIDFFKKLFGKNKVDYKVLLENGAQIIDVRTPAEFSNGSIRNSKNIPLQELVAEMKKLDMKKPIITCCASGMRSASANIIFEQNGFEAYNGGNWKALENKLNK